LLKWGKGGEDRYLGRARQRLENLVTKEKTSMYGAEELIDWSEFKDFVMNEIEEAG
jgi:hypothetical protein